MNHACTAGRPKLVQGKGLVPVLLLGLGLYNKGHNIEGQLGLRG